jgi:magnesium-transporting ATPase (P-type)
MRIFKNKNYIMRRNILILAVCASTAFMPLLSNAQGAIEPYPQSPVRSISDIVAVLRFVVRIVFTLLMIVAIIMIIYAGFKYLTAMGDPGAIQTAHRALVWAAVAIAVGLLAEGVRAIVESILTRQG